MSSEREVIIEVRGVHTAFGDHVVHDELDLDVYRGEVLGVVGGSGTGKSVLLRAIVGLLRPQKGKVQVFGTDILSASDAEFTEISKRWGVMFQDGALFSSLNVQQNVEAPMRELLDVAADTRAKLAQLKLSMVGLPDKARRDFPSDLSGGMRKRAGLARALSLDPEIVFLDEPTAGLDPIGAAAFDQLIRRLTDTLGLTVFLVTHDLDSLHAICDRVAVLAEKKVLVTGTMKEMLDVDHPWVREYFHGPRARAALETGQRTRLMETRANYVLIGAFTVGSILAALGFFVWLAKVQIDRQYDRYDLLFTSVAGLSEAADVNMNGVSVGKVTSIDLDDEDPSQVRVRIEVTSGTPVKEDTDARLTPQGVTGLSIVTLSGGSAAAPMLTSTDPDGIPEIEGDPSLVQQLSEEAPDLLNEAVTLLRDLQGFVSEENQDYVSDILSNVDLASGQLERVIEDFSSITETVAGATDRISGFTEILEPVASSLATTLEHADATLIAATAAFDKSQETMDAATRALESADGAIAGVDTVIQDAATGVTSELNRTLVDLRGSISSIESDAGEVLDLFGQTAVLANARLVTLNETLNTIDKAMLEATETMEAVESASISIETLVEGDAAEFVSEGRLLVGDARIALASVNQVLEDDLPAVVADVRASADLAAATLDQISQDVTNFTADLAPVPEKLAGTLDGATATFANANQTLDAVEQTLTTADETLVTIRGVVQSADEQIISEFAPVASDLSLAATRVSTSMETIAADVPDLVAELREILDTAGNIVTRVDGVVANSSGPVQDFAVTGLGDLTRFSQEARNLVERLDRIAARLERDPARFFLGGQAPDYRR